MASEVAYVPQKGTLGLCGLKCKQKIKQHRNQTKVKIKEIRTSKLTRNLKQTNKQTE